jgi:hypothetical protein
MKAKDKGLAAERLASFGFHHTHIAQIVDLSDERVKKIIKFDSKVIGGVRGWFDKFNPDTLDALTLITVGWEDDEDVNVALVMRVLRWGTGLHCMSYMTGIPAEKLREAIQRGFLR